MEAKINNSLLPKLTSDIKPYEVRDVDLKGFLVRVQPTGKLTFYCDYRLGRKRNRIKIGSPPQLTPAQARDRAREILASAIYVPQPIHL